MFGISPLLPAYGRDYKSQKDVLADWNANKDFLTAGGQYTSKSDLVKFHPGQTITIRYDKNRKVMSVKL
jgi:hypothetical protein